MQDTALPAQRRAELVRYVRERGHATVTELATGFGVSVDTIRRDLDHLARRRLLARTHGGAMALGERATADTPFENRISVHKAAKQAIGARAARLISDDETVLINGGTTTLEVVRALTGKRNLTVVTNNLRVPSEIPPDVVRDLYVIGGACRVASMVTVGPVGFAGTRGISADVAVIGVGGVSGDNGLSTTNLPEAQMIRQMIESSSRVVIVADSSKFSRNTFVHICDLKEVSVLVTDSLPPDDLVAALDAAGVDLETADTADLDEDDTALRTGTG
ncbi:DeoR/GlpR family DNA-binding transcription regulator [Actinoallomurus acanthiterrae]